MRERERERESKWMGKKKMRESKAKKRKREREIAVTQKGKFLCFVFQFFGQTMVDCMLSPFYKEILLHFICLFTFSFFVDVRKISILSSA